MAWCCQP